MSVTPSGAAPSERADYVPGYGAAAHRFMTERTAAEAADFLLPYLRPGMRLLDGGCGPGSITVGLAAAVAPGEVVGIDREPVQIERARALAAARAVPNVRFEVADLLALPYPDAAFDAAFAHAVLMHVGDRPAALRELRRVTRPGGLVAVKDLRTDEQILEPSTPRLREFLALLDRTRRHHGVPTSVPQGYRALLRRAGLIDVQAAASCTSYGTPEAVRAIAAFHLAQARGEALRRTATEQGWATPADLDAICAALEAWGDHPDAFRVEVWCAAVGRVPS